MDDISLHSINSIKINSIKQQENSIPFRLELIKNLIGGKIDPIINFDCTATDNFIDDDGSSIDTRTVLKKEKLNIFDVIKKIGGKLTYIKSGSTGHTFKGIIENDNGDEVCYAVKVVAFSKKGKYGDMYDVRRPENAELKMIKLLSYFVVNEQTPHIVLPIATFDTKIDPFVSLIKDGFIDGENKKYMEFVDKYNKGEYYDNVSILLSEWANRGDLLEFFRKKYKFFKLIHYKVFFAQIISVLIVIQSKYPSFRHNDFKPNNILVDKTNNDEITHNTHYKYKYTIGGHDYMIPDIGYQIKIWDFDFACIPGIVDNSKVSSDWTKAINVTPEQNRYYDLHYFFNMLIKPGFFPEIMEDRRVPCEVKDFINRVVPIKYQTVGKYTHKRGRILIKKEYTTPDEVLRTDPFFESFRHYKSKKTSLMGEDVDLMKGLKTVTKKKVIKKKSKKKDIDISELMEHEIRMKKKDKSEKKRSASLEPDIDISKLI